MMQKRLTFVNNALKFQDKMKAKQLGIQFCVDYV